MNLQPLTPEEGVEMYLESRRSEVSADTLSSHAYRLKEFVKWCELAGMSNLNDLTGRDLHRFRIYRRDQGLKPITLQGQLSTLRKFLEFCATIDGVPDGLNEKIILPSTSRHEEARDVRIESDHAESILAYLERYQFASRDHAIFALAWNTAMRMGGMRALDVDDYDPDDQCLEVRHRPESDTPLKNGYSGERDVALSHDVAHVLNEYIEVNREQSTDEYRRDPLLSTWDGRLSRSALRNTFYRLTRPCLIDECPHDVEPLECDANTKRSAWSLCPSSLSAHPIRRGSITYQLKNDIPEDIVSGRVNATRDILAKHYDRRTEREKMDVRRKYLNSLHGSDTKIAVDEEME